VIRAGPYARDSGVPNGETAEGRADERACRHGENDALRPAPGLNPPRSQYCNSPLPTTQAEASAASHRADFERERERCERLTLELIRAAVETMNAKEAAAAQSRREEWPCPAVAAGQMGVQ
jgi:hypothetical protein